MSKLKMAVTFSRGINRKENVKKLLNIDAFILNPRQYVDCRLVVGWGKKESTEVAVTYAQEHKLDYCSLEDGFIHSMGQGVLGADSCSLVVDSKGIYYDATKSSDLEKLISTVGDQEDNPLRLKNLIQRLIHSNISKYNNGSLQLNDQAFKANEVVLVIDQTAGDMSLKYGYAAKKTFDDMLQAALDENPAAQIIVKTHPDVIVGKKKGNIDISSLDSRVHLVSEAVNPLVLLKKVDIVYVATSQMGFEALMLGKRVICFGVPFYSGWGLTDDRADKNLSVWKRRNQQRTVEEVFAAAYIEYSRYLHPDTQERCELEDIIDYFELQNKYRSNDFNKRYCIGFPRWKQNHIRAFLSTNVNADDSAVFLSASTSSAKKAIKKGFDKHSQIVTWASKNQKEVDILANEFGITPWKIEDGFIRSTGLGTDLTAPASLVLDKSGIYYDPSQASDLETLLQTKAFSSAELARAEALKNALLENELSKYNLGKGFDKSLLGASPAQKIILIPGQVEGDASIIKGCVDVKTNTDLIMAVRKNEPEAYLIYKPHPDVVSGNRKGKVNADIVRNHIDLELTDTSITDCLASVDEVHTMTSLVGFEGLMRGLNVVCYGLPFYSNWGLTEDKHPLKRRTKKLTLNELVAGALIDYPLYINWQTQAFTTPEVIVQQLKDQLDKQGGKKSNHVFLPFRIIRKVKNFITGVLVK